MARPSRPAAHGQKPSLQIARLNFSQGPSSYAHRLVDGREAVQSLVRIKDCIEDPKRLLLEVAGVGTLGVSRENPLADVAPLAQTLEPCIMGTLRIPTSQGGG